MATMYVTNENNTLILRQTRFRDALAAGHEHPHDICAYASSVAHMRAMVAHHFPNDVDYSAVEEQKEFHDACMA